MGVSIVFTMDKAIPPQGWTNRCPHHRPLVANDEACVGCATMDVLLAGDDDHGAALESALRERGFGTRRFDDPGELAGMLVALEEILQGEAPRLALGVGSGDASLALAISAPKLGVPFVAWLGRANADRPDERRILETLSAPSTLLGDDISGVAERIATRLRPEPPARITPLDSRT